MAPVIGFNQVELSLYGQGGAPPVTDLDLVAAGIAATGATWVRILMDWRLIESAPGVYDWSYMDAALTAVTNVGLNVLLTANDAPFWAYTPTAFATFVTTAVQRYGPGGSHSLVVPVRSWEIWNEPNYIFGFPPGGNGIPGMYAYQKAAYDALHAVDSGAFVISAGLIALPNTFGAVDSVTWLTGMYAAGPSGGPYPWDGVGFHPYTATQQEPTQTDQFIAEIPQLYQVMSANGDASKPIWLTEFGFETQPSGLAGGTFVTPAVQAQWLVEQITNMQAVADRAGVTLGPKFLYNWRNSQPDNGIGSGQYGMGVVNFDFTPKPALAAIRAFISGGAPVGVTTGGTVIKPPRPTLTMSSTGPSGVTVGGTVIKPPRPTLTMSGTTVSGIAAANWGALGIALNPVGPSMNSFQDLADLVVGIPGATAAELASVIAGIASTAGSAGQAATSAAANFVALFTGVVGDVEADIAALLASLTGTASTSVVNTNQIAALWAHVQSSGTAGIHYSFDSTVSLTANYPGTSNPSWAAAGPLALPTVPPATAYAACTFGATEGMVFIGNPNNVVTGDHGLVTDRSQVYSTIGLIGFGNAQLFMSGHFASGTLGQNVAIELAYGGPAAIRLYVCTGANSGKAQQTFDSGFTQYDLPTNPKVTDVIGIQHDGGGVYTLYYNNMAVDTWTDSGALVTHGPGFRECGMILFGNGFNQATIGLGSFTALDYV